MAAFCQEIALQWELGWEFSFFTVPKFDTWFEHSDSGNHVAGATWSLILHATSKIVPFKVGPIEFTVEFCDWIWIIEIHLGSLKDIFGGIEPWMTSLSKSISWVVSKAFHVNLWISHCFPWQFSFIDQLSEIDSCRLVNIVKSAHCAFGFSLRELHRCFFWGGCSLGEIPTVRVVSFPHGYSLSVIYHVADYVFSHFLSMHAAEFFVSLLFRDTNHCLSTDVIEFVIVASCKIIFVLGRGRFEFISEVCRQSLFRQMNQKSLVIHHCPFAIGILTSSWWSTTLISIL